MSKSNSPDENEKFDEATLVNGDDILTVSLPTITPSMAKHWLDTCNVRNRQLKHNHVRGLADDITAGEWIVTGETIVFDDEGMLSDGQNRLAAIVKADIPVTSLVVQGVNPIEAQDRTGARQVKRSLADQLHMRGENEARNLAAAVSTAMHLEKYGDLVSSQARVPSISAAVSWLEQNPEIRESVPVGRRVNTATGFMSSVASALHFLFRRVDSEDADAFFAALTTGADLSEGDPILLLRDKIATIKATQGSSSGISKNYLAAVTIKAWNAWRSGEQIKQLRYKPGGASKETFPRWDNQP